MKRIIRLTIIVTVFLAACGPLTPESISGGSGQSTPIVVTPVVITAEVSTVVASTMGPPPTEGPSPTPIPPTLIPTLPFSGISPTELKYRVLEHFPDFFFCDPDYYPVARDDEIVLAGERFAELQANQEEFQTILRHNGLAGTKTFTDEQVLLIYREHKRLNAIYFYAAGDKYQFQIQTGKEGQQGSVITATIDATASIEVQKKEPSFPTCPICLAAGTLIDTPRGAVAVENLQIGDSVWTMNGAGERVLGKILRTAHVAVPTSHQIVHVVLSDGRELWASPGHPTTDDRRVGDLKVNDLLDGAKVIHVERVAYGGPATYDILPSGDTGFYWANGVLLGSTLSKH